MNKKPQQDEKVDQQAQPPEEEVVAATEEAEVVGDPAPTPSDPFINRKNERLAAVVAQFNSAPVTSNVTETVEEKKE